MSEEAASPLAQADGNVRRPKALLEEAKKFGEPQERLDQLQRLLEIAQEDLERVTGDSTVN